MPPLNETRPVDSDSLPRKRQLLSAGLISVVIPCYNQGQFLSDAIKSVLAQTWKRVELIVVDDGSMDNSSSIAQQFPTVRCVRQAHKGLGAARNAGLALSAGEYIAFLDADDRLVPCALKLGAEYLSKHPDDAFVHGDFRPIGEDGTAIGAVDSLGSTLSGYVGLLQKNYIAMHGTVLYRREIIQRLGGFNPLLEACEDYELYLRIARAHRFGYHRHLIAEVRHHDHNMSRDAALMLRTSLGVLRSEKRFIASNKDLNKALREGEAFFRKWYGERLFASVATRLRRSGLKKDTLRDMLTLVNYYPRAIVSLLRAFEGFVRNPMRPIPVGSVRFGNLRRLSPVSRTFGFDRGVPVDRHYIEGFLGLHRQDIRGRVLEIADNSYTLKFGGDRVTQSDVLSLIKQRGVSIVAELSRADHIPSNTFDCVILTQTLQLIYDVRSALRTVHRILKPGGVLLVTVPGISQICVDPQKTWSDFWRFTDASLTSLLQEVFLSTSIHLDVYGNVLSAIAFLEGLSVAELKESELNHYDPEYQVIVAARAEKEHSLNALEA